MSKLTGSVFVAFFSLLIIAVAGRAFLDYHETQRISQTVRRIALHDAQSIDALLKARSETAAWHEYLAMDTLCEYLATPCDASTSGIRLTLVKLRHAEGAMELPILRELANSLEVCLQAQRTTWPQWKLRNPLQDFVLARAEQGSVTEEQAAPASTEGTSPKEPSDLQEEVPCTPENHPATAQAETSHVSCLEVAAPCTTLQEAAIHTAIGARALVRSKGRHAQEEDAPVENPVVPTAADFQKAKANIQLRMKVLERLLHGDPAKEASWKHVLHWSVLENALQAENADIAGLKDVHEQLSQGVAGLELECFASLRQAIAGYLRLDALRVNDNAAQRSYANALATAQNLLEQGSASSILKTDSEATGTETAGIAKTPAIFKVPDSIESALEWLRLTEATRELVEKAETTWSKPNVAVTVRNQLLEKHANLLIQQKQPIQEQIGPNQITGSADFTGKISVQFVPNEERAALNLTLDGSALGKSYTFSHPVHVWSDSNTRILARKEIGLDGYGFYAGKTQVSVNPSSQITGIRDVCNRHLIEMFAFQIANTQKESMQAMLGERQSHKIGKEFDTQINPALRDLNEQIAREFWPHLSARGFHPRDVKMSTTADQLNLAATVAGNGRQGAPKDAPALETSSDIEFSIHESAIQNLLVGFLGNMNCNSKTRAAIEKTAPKLIQDALSRMQEKVKAAEKEPAEDLDAWSIVFAEEPVSVTFADNKLTFVVHTKSIQGKDRSYPAVNITIRYRVEVRDGKLFLVQDAPVDILPPTFDPTKGKRLPAEIVSLRRVMSRRLQEFLPAEAELEPMTFPIKADLMNAANTAAGTETKEQQLTVEIVTFTAQNGWLQIGLNVNKQAQ